jgi:hypothetical protein
VPSWLVSVGCGATAGRECPEEPLPLCGDCVSSSSWFVVGGGSCCSGGTGVWVTATGGVSATGGGWDVGGVGVTGGAGVGVDGGGAGAGGGAGVGVGGGTEGGVEGGVVDGGVGGGGGLGCSGRASPPWSGVDPLEAPLKPSAPFGVPPPRISVAVPARWPAGRLERPVAVP